MKKISQTNLTERPPIIGVGTFTASPLAKKLVMEVLDNNRLSYGPMLQKFEADFAKIHGSRHGIMSNSGTSALQLALQTLKELHNWADGDEVIVPALTFVATANIVLHTRMTPVLVDVDPIYYSLNPALIEKAISKKTRAIIPVHLFGQPADMDPILEVAKKYSLKVIEDSAETMFANYKGRRVGALGDIGCFSTYVAHLLVTGVGGLNTTNNNEYAIKIRSLLNHGRDSIYLNIDDDKNKNLEELIPIIERRFKFISIGHSFRVTEMEGALGLAQLETWQPDIEKRRLNAQYLTQGLLKYSDEIQLPEIRPECDHSFMMYPIIVRDESKRKLVNHLESYGVETRDMLPLTNQPVYHNLLGWRESDYPVAEWINNNGFYIGCHQDLTIQDLDYVLSCFDGFFASKTLIEKYSTNLVLFCESNFSIEDLSRVRPYLELFSDVQIFLKRVDSQTIEKQINHLSNIQVVQYDDDLMSAVIRAYGGKSTKIIFFPLNGRWDSRDIPRIFMMLNRGYDLVVASRFSVGGRRQWLGGKISSIGNRLFNFGLSVLYGGNLSDSFSSLRGLNLDKVKNHSFSGSSISEMFYTSILAVKKGWSVYEIPTTEIIQFRRDIMDDLKSAWPALKALVRECVSK